MQKESIAVEAVEPLHVRAVVVASKPSCAYDAWMGSSRRCSYDPWMHCRSIGHSARY